MLCGCFARYFYFRVQQDKKNLGKPPKLENLLRYSKGGNPMKNEVKNDRKQELLTWEQWQELTGWQVRDLTLS